MPIPRPIHHLSTYLHGSLGCPPAHTLILQHHALPVSDVVNVPSQSHQSTSRYSSRNELPALQRY
ncbi:hypothetical protein LZ32DRAFT_607434 [Colletotrichum eremochloae]|nr:hypothetical protein LZ32DRAFT_607434 [Colletotrichum eremochloae]